MNKKSLSESDICDRFISPSLISAGWDETRWRREYPFTAGRIIVRGELIARGKKKRADYLLFFKSNIPIAIIEANDNTHSIGAGMQQGLDPLKYSKRSLKGTTKSQLLQSLVLGNIQLWIKGRSISEGSIMIFPKS